MTGSEAAWGQMPSSSDMRPCIRCENTTRSHTISVADTGHAFVPAEASESDFMFAVCHTCYREVDGSADAMCEYLDEGRVDQLDEMGVSPGTLAEMNTTEQMDTERVKALGEAPVEEMVADLSPGDVVEVNDEHEWILAPTSENLREKLNEELVFTLLGLGDDPAAGGIVRSEHPMKEKLYIAQHVGEGDQPLDYKPIESLELLGRKDLDMEPLDYDDS